MRLLISYSGALGGAERALVEFSGGLGGDCCMACPPGALAEAARERGMRVFSLRPRSLELRRRPIRAATALVGHARETDALITALEPEIVIAWGMRSAIALLGTPAGLLARPRGLRAPVVFGHCDFLPGPSIGAVVRRAAASADRVLVLSSAVAADLDPSGRLGDRIVVVYPGVDIDHFAASTQGVVEPPEIVVVGALVGWKHPELALEILAQVRRRRPEVRLRLVGGPLESSGQALIERLRARASEPDLAGAVEFTGPVADVGPELARASILLHCALREPFGVALVEALAAGRPVVAPDAAGPREIVDRSCGVLYAPGDVGAAASSVLALLADPDEARAMGARGQELARSRFGLSHARSAFAQAVLPVARHGDRHTSVGSAGPLPRMALVTVTHQSAEDLDRLLGSVARYLPETRVLVIDCGSSDPTAEVARRERSGIEVKFVALGHNPGFGSGCNHGLQLVHEPVAVLLNPDVELIDGSLVGLVEEALREGSAKRLLAPLVILPDGSRQDTVHPRPTSAADLAHAVIPPALVAGPLAPALEPLAPWRARRPRRVGWAVGCALVARTETFRRLGPFDERIFMYGEDLDLGLRAGAADVETWFWPSARVLHRRAHATERAFGGEPFERLARARHDVVARRLGPGRARLDDLSQAVTFASRMSLKRALGRPSDRERRQLEALALLASPR